MTLNRRTFVKLSALPSVALGVNAKSAVITENGELLTGQAKSIEQPFG